MISPRFFSLHVGLALSRVLWLEVSKREHACLGGPVHGVDVGARHILRGVRGVDARVEWKVGNSKAVGKGS